MPNAKQPGTIGIIALTKGGVQQAKRLASALPQAEIMVLERFDDQLIELSNPRHLVKGALSAEIGPWFQRMDQLVFFAAMGAVIRLIAPLLESKRIDPGVLVIDEKAGFVIPALSGHLGGANRFGEQVAKILGSTLVITTSSDLNQTLAVDLLGQELSWHVEATSNQVTKVSALVVNQEPIALIQEAGSKNWWPQDRPLPDNIHLFESFEQVKIKQYQGFLWITHRKITPEIQAKLNPCLVVYRPPDDFVLGVGCDRGTSLKTLQTGLDRALKKAGIKLEQIRRMATIDKKQDEEALLELAQSLAMPLLFYPAQSLAQVKVPNPSAIVLKYMGTPAVSEAAALLEAKAPLDHLLLEKCKYRGLDDRNVTFSLVKIP